MKPELVICLARVFLLFLSHFAFNQHTFGDWERGFISTENKSPPSSHKAQVQSPRLIIRAQPRVADTVVKEGEVLVEFLGKIIQCLRSWFVPFMMNDDIEEINNNI